MDNTIIFKTCVRTIRTRNRACGIPDVAKPRNERRAGKFNTRAKEILHQIAKLGAFISDTSSAYSNFSGHIPGAPFMSDLERDRIDAGVPRLAEEARKMLTDLEYSVPSKGLAPQLREHQTGVIRLIKNYLSMVIKFHTDLRTHRAARALEVKKMARLDTRARSESISTERPTPTIQAWTPDDDDDAAPDNLSPEELQVFEQENSALQAELSGLMSELDHLESTVTGLATLQQQLTEKIVEQEMEIDQVAAKVVNTTENVKDANEQLRQAIQRNAGQRVYILFFLIVMSFSLLFLDWYND